MFYRKIAYWSILVLLISCNSGKNEKQMLSTRHGGTLHINEPGFTWNLNPHQIQDENNKVIAYQIYEGLLRYNPKNLILTPGLAKYWVFKNNGTDYVFYLRTNAYFHKNKCFKTPDNTRKIIAEDFVYSFKKLCTFSQKQKTFPIQLAEILGAEEYFNISKNGIEPPDIKGIKAINDSVLQISIKKPNSLFINVLAEINMAVIPKEAVDLYGDAIFTGSGPFYLKSFETGQKKLTLYRNKNYYFKDRKGFSLPYFNEIEISFIHSVDKEIELFEQGSLDIIFDIPSRIITPFLNSHINDFKGERAKFILIKDEAGGLKPTYILQYNYIKNFSSNRHNIIDFTRVYFQKNE
ncbi:MAG: hypothetical protein GXO79_13675 [Chlorobi bacterium]|nr:hypothetical protein [Chlorobiota bacterium]